MTLDWTTRSTLRLYPRWWRDEFEQEVIGTLLDVAESEQRSRPSVRELVPLALRGAWMRARRSVVFWVGLVIIAVMVWAVGASFDGFESERYWPVMLSKAGTGLLLALPLAGGAAAWQAGARRERVRLPHRLRNLAEDAAGPAAFVAIGYLAALTAQLIASGWPLSAHGDPGTPVAFLCLLVAALAVGLLLGTLVHRAAAAALSVVALTAWHYLYSLGGDTAWANLTGMGVLVWGPTTLYEVSQPVSVAAASLTALVIATLAVLLIIVKSAGGWAWFGVLAVLIGVAVAVNAPALTAGPALGPAARSGEHIVCAGEEPRICLWPEQEAQSGAMVRETVTEAWSKAVALGVPVPSTVSVVGTGRDDDSTLLYWRQAAYPDRILSNYASQVSYRFACSWWESDSDEYPATTVDYELAQQSAAFAAAIALGTDPSVVRPIIQMGGDASEPPTKTLDLAETEDYFGVHSVAEAEEVLLAWVERGPTCE